MRHDAAPEAALQGREKTLLTAPKAAAVGVDQRPGAWPARLWLTVPEAGRLLGMGRSSAYEAARRGQIPTLRLGRRLLVPVPALRRLLGDVGHDGGEDDQ